MIYSHARSPRGAAAGRTCAPTPTKVGAPGRTRPRPAGAQLRPFPSAPGREGLSGAGAAAGSPPRGQAPGAALAQLRVPPAPAPAGGRAAAQSQAPAPSAPPAASAPRGSPRRGRAWRGGGGSGWHPPTGPGCGHPRGQALPQRSLGSARGGRQRGGLQRAGEGPAPSPGPAHPWACSCSGSAWRLGCRPQLPSWAEQLQPGED